MEGCTAWGFVLILEHDRIQTAFQILALSTEEYQIKRTLKRSAEPLLEDEFLYRRKKAHKGGGKGGGKT
jgi:hypothetical protein